MKKINLNEIQPEFDGIRPFSADFHVGDIEAFTSNLETRIVERIARADFICGCMAWLTNRTVLGALSRLSGGCQIVVQKEDFIRPGIVGKGELRRLYGALRGRGSGYELPLPANGLNVCGDAVESVPPIKCMGIANPSHRMAMPRMHHKFLVFCRNQPGTDIYEGSSGRPCMELIPYAVWTGSFNATENAVNSRENAIYIENQELAQYYCTEWATVYALSEPLDWTCQFVDSDNAKRFGS